jgi:hypothetical protein
LDNGTHTIKVRATDREGHSQERESHIGVNVAWNYSPSPTSTITPTATLTPTITPTIASSH